MPLDLDAVGAIVGDARVVGLGESLHAVSEMYRLKDRVFRHLVEHHGFRWFVLESGFAEGLLVDDWINGRTDTPIDDVLRDGFTYNMGCCEEFVEQLTWMRSWNRDHSDDPVRFAGTDLPAWLDTNRPAIDVASAFLGRVAPGTSVPDDVDELAALLANREPVFARRSDRESAAVAKRAAEVACSWRDYKHFASELGLHSPLVSAARDLTMAETVLWLLQLHGPATRIVFGAHNGHLQRTAWTGDESATAGIYLAHHLGDSYVPIGTTFGSATGFGEAEPIDVELGIQPHGFGAAAEDTVDHVLSLRGDETVVDLRADSVAAPRMRLQGYAIPIEAATAFDALIHLEQVSLFHARSLGRPDG